ncbi:MAG: hypothetical protein ABWX70_03075 [Hyphomicrobium sp.]
METVSLDAIHLAEPPRVFRLAFTAVIRVSNPDVRSKADPAVTEGALDLSLLARLRRFLDTIQPSRPTSAAIAQKNTPAARFS